MMITCELLIIILQKVVPNVKNHYGCLSYDCNNLSCASEFHSAVDQVSNLKGVSKQWKYVLENFVIKKHLMQLLFLHEQMRIYRPDLRFVLQRSGAEAFNLGLHPLKAEEDSANLNWISFLKSVILAPECISFDEVYICPAELSSWLPRLLKELEESKSTERCHIKRLRIGSCSYHELPYLEFGSRQYRLLIQLHDTIKKVAKKPRDFILKNPIYCIECKKLDFCEWNQSAPSITFCSACQEPIDLQIVCCKCITMCSCWKTHYDYDILSFLKNCGSFICKYCVLNDGRDYFSISCPNIRE